VQADILLTSEFFLSFSKNYLIKVITSFFSYLKNLHNKNTSKEEKKPKINQKTNRKNQNPILIWEKYLNFNVFPLETKR